MTVYLLPNQQRRVMMEKYIDKFQPVIGESANETLDRVKALKKINKKEPYYFSKLDIYKYEIWRLYNEGGTLSDIVTLLKYDFGLSVNPSTVHRKLKKWIAEK